MQKNLKTPPKKLRTNKWIQSICRIQDQHTSLVFLYTNNKLSESKIKKIIPFITVLRRIKYLRINLIKKVKDQYSEN